MVRPYEVIRGRIVRLAWKPVENFVVFLFYILIRA